MTRSPVAGPRKAPNGTWWFVVDVGEVDGKRRQAKRRGFVTKKAAQEEFDRLKVDVHDNAYVAPKRQSVGQYLLDDWLPSVTHDLKPATAASYERYLRLHDIPAIGRVQLVELEPGHLDKLYAELRGAGARKDGKAGTLAPRTVRYVHTIIRKALADAVRSRRLKWNAADAARPGKATADQNRPEVRTWSGDQLSAFIGAETGTRYGPLWVFLATTGCRRGEALGLRWSDVADDYSSVTIRQTLITISHPNGPRTVEYGTPKTHKPRVVDLDARTGTALRSVRAIQAAERLAFGAGYRDEGLVFCLPDGRPYHPERVSREFDRRITRHGLDRIRLHDLRHTWATLALAAGVDVKIVSERLGHSTTSFTRDVYMHVTPAMQTVAAEKVALLVFGNDA